MPATKAARARLRARVKVMALRISDRSDLPFGYRHSGISPGTVVIAAELLLKHGSIDEIQLE